jgi:hypothetical protein
MRHDKWASSLVESAHPALRACAIIITSFSFAGDMKRLSSNNGPWGPNLIGYVLFKLHILWIGFPYQPPSGPSSLPVYRRLNYRSNH